MKWTILAAGFDFAYTVILFTHLLKCVPLGAIGSLHNGIDIVLATVCVYICRKIVPSCMTIGGAVLAVVGICLTLYPALYPVFNPGSESDHLARNTSFIPSNLTIENYLWNNESSSSNLTWNVSIVNKTLHDCNEDSCVEDTSRLIIRIKRSNTVRGVLAVMAASIPCTLFLMILSGPLKEENTFALNFWFGIISTPIAFAISCALETPLIPDATTDILLCCLYATTAAMVNFTEAIAMKYVSPVLYDVVYAMDIPLMLFVEHVILSIAIDGGKLEIVGATVVFFVGVGLPIVEYFYENGKWCCKVKNCADNHNMF